MTLLIYYEKEERKKKKKKRRERERRGRFAYNDIVNNAVARILFALSA